jgi:hypothetical protein
MGIRREIERKIERKEKELRELEQETAIRLREGAAYIQALQESLKLLPKESPDEITVVLRAGSAVTKARDAIREAGRPLHVSELLKILGKPITPVAKAGLAGSLAWYVRKNEIFTRPAPNTFGLVELNGAKEVPESALDFEGFEGQEPPENFGLENGTATDDDE